MLLQMKPDVVDVSFLIPCLDEAESLEHVIGEIRAACASSDLSYEVLVADNGSSDGSQEIARRCGARVADIEERGYGSALRGGIKAAAGEWVVMGDADGSYQFADALPMLDRLRDGADVVMGNRFDGGIERGAMPPLHRYLGNPVLSWLGRLLFGVPVRDFHCGLRAFNRFEIERLGLESDGMEFASEMLVRAHKAGLSIEEVPVRLLPDLRSRPPHLRSWRDGWRHLRFLLLHAPAWTFALPSSLAGSLAVLLALLGPLHLGSVEFSYRTGVLASALAVVALVGGWSAHLAHIVLGQARRVWSTEAMLAVSCSLLAVGVVVVGAQFLSWEQSGFGEQPVGRATLGMITGSLALAAGGISFFFSLLVGTVRNLR
ncbi:MAG: glycosyltransferase family 2 protein [Nocardioides sp.]|uniref:glycosyltransferase family 2 protein n=1 Tax=Nocardioides sp. TaxID=35761 RepID=UPI0039E3AFB3